MSKINLEQLRADREAGTDGPWTIGNGGLPHGAEFEIRCVERDWYITGISWGDDVWNAEIPRYPEAESIARRIARLPDLEAAYINAVETIQSIEQALMRGDEAEAMGLIGLFKETQG